MKTEVEKNCRHCGESFKTSNERRISCSSACNSSFYKKKNPEKHNALARQYWRSLDAEQRKHRHIRTNYGISIQTFREMEKKQELKCAICKEVLKLHVDHSHKTGTIRDLLCNGCNRGLGFFSENIEALIRAAEYLKKWDKK